MFREDVYTSTSVSCKKILKTGLQPDILQENQADHKSELTGDSKGNDNYEKT